MPRRLSRFQRFRASRKKIYWTESRARRDAAVAARRAADVVMGTNRATRGLILSPGEFKSVDTAVVGAVDSTGSVTLINGIARGDDINERDGREVTMKSIQCTVQLYVTDTTGLDQSQRILVVYDKQTNAAAPAVTDILTAATVFSPRNLENRKRFTVLMDRCYTLNASAESGSSRLFKWYRRLRHPITFNSGNAGTVADIVTGGLYVVLIGNRAAGATAGAIDSYFRVRYLDH